MDVTTKKTVLLATTPFSQKSGLQAKKDAKMLLGLIKTFAIRIDI